MDGVKICVTVLFENPFWIGLCEREVDGRYEVCRTVFGAEPKDYEVYAYYLAHYRELRFSPAMEAETQAARRISPKRLQRQIRDAVQSASVGTRAQQALKLQQEAGKEARKKRAKETREAERQRQLDLHREKQKEKHRGH